MDASIMTMSAYRFPELADISQTGAKLKGGPLPPRGTTGLFKVGNLEVLCRVVWTDGEQCGIRFDETVSPGVLKQIQLEGGAALEALGVSNGKTA